MRLTRHGRQVFDRQRACSSDFLADNPGRTGTGSRLAVLTLTNSLRHGADHKVFRRKFRAPGRVSRCGAD